MTDTLLYFNNKIDSIFTTNREELEQFSKSIFEQGVKFIINTKFNEINSKMIELLE